MSPTQTQLWWLSSPREFIEPPLDKSVPDTFVHNPAFELQVEEYLKGGGPSTIVVLEPSTTYHFDAGGQLITGQGSLITFDVGAALEGQRFALFLEGASTPFDRPGTCAGSTRLTGVPGTEGYVGNIRAVIAAGPSELVRSGGTPVARTRDAASSTLPAAAAVVFGLVVFLAGAAFVWRRGDPHSG